MEDFKIKTFIINLKISSVRKIYMESLLKPYTFLDIDFIDAIDGRSMTNECLKDEFDFDFCLRHLGRYLNEGEIGCVLSHRKAYEKLLMSNVPYALILEDDISIIRDLRTLLSYNLDALLVKSEPIVLFLSGDYWFYKKSNGIVSCYDALGAYAYIINRAAAQLIVNMGKPYSVADDWLLYKNTGVKLKAILPYMIDANLNMDVLSSDVKQYQWGVNRKKMCVIDLLSSLKSSLIRRGLKFLGCYESKIRVIDGKIVCKS